MISGITLKIKIKYNTKIQIMATPHLTVDSIIRKYEQRQEQLAHSLTLDQINAIDINRDKDPYQKIIRSGAETPEFSDFTNRKQMKPVNEDAIQRTHKKNQNYQSFNPKEIISSPFRFQASSKQDYQKILNKLDQTEEKLARSERNYAQIFRKYELLLSESKKSQKSVEIQQRLRGKESTNLNDRIDSLEKENNNLKECLNAKDSNIAVLREKLKEKNQRFIQSERTIDSLRAEIEKCKSKQSKTVEQQEKRQRQRDQIVQNMKNELSRFQDLMKNKQTEKKELLLELENNFFSHKEELEVLRMSYSQVQQEYKQWIEDCKKEKAQMVQEYQSKLKSYQRENMNSPSSDCLNSLKKELDNKNEQIQSIMTQNIKLTRGIKKVKEELQGAENVKKELIIKVSTLENSVIQKLDHQKSLEQNLGKLQNFKRGDQEKNLEITKKYNKVNSQLQELKSKYNQLVQEIEQKNESRRKQAHQIIRLKKEIETLRERVQNSRNNETSLSDKLSQTVAALKKKSVKFDEEKHELLSEFMAEKLQTARLREELQEMKVHLKRQYDLSIENTKKQLEQKIKANLSQQPSACDLEKEQLYLQVRELERRYELLASEIVSVDDMMGLAAKIQRRYHPKK